MSCKHRWLEKHQEEGIRHLELELEAAREEIRALKARKISSIISSSIM
jgi:hypothetical protein